MGVLQQTLDDRTRCGYLTGYAATTGFILYWNPDQNFVIHRAHHVWFDEYTYILHIEYKHTPVYLLLQQDPYSIIRDL